MTTNTKTRKPKASSTGVLDSIKALEDQILADVTTAHSAIAEATAKVAHWESEAEDTRQAVEDIEDAWSAGDDALTADDHTRALAEAKRADSLLSAARGALAIAERKAKVNTDKVGPDALTSALRKVLPSEYVQTVATIAPAPPSITEAVCIVSSSGADDVTERLGWGLFSQPVTITYVRPPMYAALVSTALARDVKTHGVEFESYGATRTHEDGDMMVDVIRGKVHRVHHDSPIIKHHPDEDTVRQALHRVATNAEDIASREVDGPGHVRNMQASVEIDKGQRISTLTGLLGASWRVYGVEKASVFGSYADRGLNLGDSMSPMSAVDEAVRALVGTLMKGAGIVTDAKSEPADAIVLNPNAQRFAAVAARRITITATSQVENG